MSRAVLHPHPGTYAMTIVVTSEGDILQLDEHLKRLKRLVEDIESMKSGVHPDPAGIAGSAYARDWILASRPVPCLKGYFEGHPHIRSGRMSISSELWIWAPDHGYARTSSRWYKLGNPLADNGGKDGAA